MLKHVKKVTFEKLACRCSQLSKANGSVVSNVVVVVVDFVVGVGVVACAVVVFIVRGVVGVIGSGVVVVSVVGIRYCLWDCCW